MAKCSVCLGPLLSDGSSSVSFSPCGHIWHNSCITRWLQDKKVCPECKASLSPASLRGLKPSDNAVLLPKDKLRAEIEKFSQEISDSPDISEIRRIASQRQEALSFLRADFQSQQQVLEAIKEEEDEARTNIFAKKAEISASQKQTDLIRRISQLYQHVADQEAEIQKSFRKNRSK
jgi:hypothetical protein